MELTDFSCEVCGSDDAEIIPAISEYQPDQPVHVCKNCGFVYVRQRRSAAEIAESWTTDLYETTYTARIPAVKARQVYVADFIDTTIGLKNKSLCDIGGGEGQFLEIVRNPEYGAIPFAIEPSERNCKLMADANIDAFQGTIEDYASLPSDQGRQFDIATIMWTLEACRSCRDMVNAAYDVLNTDGHIVIATGSRILVPFKKPMHYYVGNDQWADTHPSRFSFNTLQGLLATSGFQTEQVNRHFDTDHLVVVARKTDRSEEISWQRDDYREVINFFGRWHQETR